MYIEKNKEIMKKVPNTCMAPYYSIIIEPRKPNPTVEMNIMRYDMPIVKSRHVSYGCINGRGPMDTDQLKIINVKAIIIPVVLSKYINITRAKSSIVMEITPTSIVIL